MSTGVEKQVIKAGSGPPVQKGDNITVHCTGTFADTGDKFWSTKDPGQKTFSFKVGVGQVISGWDEGCLMMVKGETSKLILAPEKAYGAGGFPAWKIPPNARLAFEIEIVAINGK